MQDLGTLGGCESLAESINLFGQVVGGSTVTGCDFSEFHGFLWTKANGMQDMGTLGGHFSEAVAINAFGQAVGSSSTENDSAFHAMLWTKAEGMRDLGTLGDGCFSTANAVNDLGHVIGVSADCDGTEHPFLWTKANGMRDIGRAPGTFGGLSGINIFGQIVGVFCPEPCSGNQHAFIWTKNTGWLDLNSLIKPNSGWELVLPSDINEWGQIAGWGFINGQLHGFLLTPKIPTQ
jgi:probable HAF family extracellular repeat protein